MTSPPTLLDVARGGATALSPQRLLLAFFLALTLGALGKSADWLHLKLGGTAVGPSGLAAGAWTSDQQGNALKAAARSVTTFSAGTGSASEPTSEFSHAELLAQVDAVYLEKRATIESRGELDQRALTFLEGRFRELRGTLDAARPRGPFEAIAAEEAAALRHLVAAMLALAPSAMLDSVADLVLRIPAAVVALAPWTILLGGLPLVVVASIVGGGLSRMALLDAGQGVHLTAFEGAGFARRRALRLALVPILPTTVGLLLVGLIVVLGGLLRVPVLDLVGGLLYGAALVLGFLVVVGGGGAVLGFPLAVASVAAGDADAADATVRSTAYIFRHPLRWLLAQLSGVVGIACGILVVAAVVTAVFGLVHWATGILGGATALSTVGSGGLGAPAPAQLPVGGMTQRVTATFIDLWDGVLLALVAAYIASAVADVASRAYLLLRYECDGQDPSTMDAVPLGRPGPG